MFSTWRDYVPFGLASPQQDQVSLDDYFKTSADLSSQEPLELLDQESLQSCDHEIVSTSQKLEYYPR